ncbi:GGDEF domain-containing protein [Catenovulum sediminis]|uniref:diguanylate cyclase n=1 Tax=Catenovulum sediminis TaxID=1740262 RepID=A0ABV1RF88_9ALTE|nr:diguanylate cyclase [Catenovulum sediminis]
MNQLAFTDQIRRKVLRTMSLAFFFIVSILASFNILFNGQYLFAALEVIFALFSLYIFITSKTSGCSPRVTFSYLLFIAALILIGAYFLPISDVLFMWGLFFPTIAYLLLGSRLGFRLTLSIFAALVMVVTAKLSASELFKTGPVLINLVTSYLAIWCVAHFFEQSRAKANDSLIKLAMTDVLTGVNNRLAFSNSLEKFYGQYLLMLDLDHFKAINDQHGHDAGDKALILVAQALNEKVAANRIFRIGGEEFCVWLPEASLVSAQIAADNLRQHIGDLNFCADNQNVEITFSGGVVKFEPSMSESNLLKQADELLYNAKVTGRNKICVAADPLPVAS